MKKRTMLVIAAAALVVIALATGGDEETTTEEAAPQEVVAEEEATEVTEEETVVEEEAAEEEVEEVAAESENVLGEVELRPLMNGTGTEQVGEYAYVASSKDAITEENLLSFFENEASNYEDANYLVIDLQDGTAFHVLSGMPMLTYGVFNTEELNLEEQWETIIVDTDSGTVSGTLHDGVAADKALFAK
ncbi:hypothetical protein EVJ24_14955 [Exiguobacterium sp. SH1S21]|uniref:hypothetical protein n=1 Tax=Exiguobacterium sp. SH1S21 TaxID=2510953 RepID=UPI00103A8883|nr:hypothetical protein [Exiguobacterium sp. SH1S21]TCI50305.1 hypothetical protein EVJ24_14955 [Exiguobacterium sp. SH1S21]